MDLITLDKSWSVVQYPSKNDIITAAIDRGRYAILSIKNCFVGAGWLVVSSCDRTNFSNYGMIDYWTDYSKIFSTNVGNAHSWVVLTNSSFMSNLAICIDCTPSSGSLTNVTVVVAPDGFNSDGTTINRPTAVSRSYTWTNVALYTTSYLYGYTVKCLYSSDNECFRVIVTHDGFCGDTAFTRSGAVISLEKPKSPSTWWSSPIVAWCCDKSNFQYGGLSYYSITNSGENNIMTWIGSNTVQLRIGTVGVGGNWITQQDACGYGMSTDGSSMMPPLYYISDNPSYPGVFGIVYDMYPSPKFHSQGTRYKTVGNARGLMKIGTAALGCPYGYICL